MKKVINYIIFWTKTDCDYSNAYYLNVFYNKNHLLNKSYSMFVRIFYKL